MKNKEPLEPIDIMEKDLPLSCPHAGVPLWDKHPRIFLEIEEGKSVICPYCSTIYRWNNQLKSPSS